MHFLFKKKLLALLLVCTAVFSMVGCSSNESKEEVSEEKVLRVGVAAEYKPWCYKDGEEIKGIDVEVLEEAAKRMGGYELKFEVASFDGMFGLLDAGKVDTVAQQISVTPERKEKYKFSEIYAYNPYKIGVREDDNSINSLEDLKGKTFVAKPVGSELEFIESYKKENDPNDEIKVMHVDSGNTEALTVSQGKADAFGYPVLTFEEMLQDSGYKLKLTGDVIFEESNAYPFLKEENEDLYNKFNEAIKSMKEDGFLADLYNKYLGIDISKPSAENK